jgi:hypothetical protein
MRSSKDDKKKAPLAVFPLTGLRLLLPAIMPSWRFFDAVTASPRLDYALLAHPDGAGQQWQEFRPRPAVLSLGAMLGRLLWNPQWNESLYLVSLSEWLITSTSVTTEVHSQRELLLRVARHLHRNTACDESAYLQIRLRFISRNGPAEQVVSQIVYVSSPCRIAGLLTP